MAGRLLTDKMNWDELTEHFLVKSGLSKYQNEFREWFKGLERLENTFFTGMIYRHLFDIQRDMKAHNSDRMIVCTGLEGCGKTMLSLQIASVLDPSFNHERICYKKLDLLKQVRNAKPGQAFVLDEGNLFLNSRDHSVRDHRVASLFMLNNGERQGTGKLYIGRGIKMVSQYGAKYKSDVNVRVPATTVALLSFYNRVPNVIDWELYTKLKVENLQNEIDMMIGDIEDTEETERFITIPRATKFINLSEDTVRTHLKAGKIVGKRIGKKWFVDKEALLSDNSQEKQQIEHNSVPL